MAMITFALILVISVMAGFPGYGQDAQRFFPKEDLMTVGTFYYPEHWPESQWERDLENMARLGFEYVHMAEFSWAFLEPQEGEYDFAWLDKVVSLAGKHNLKVMLCTPTATTPVWMGDTYPEIYLMNGLYMRMEHGTRQMASLSNAVYREFARKIVTELAKRYGQNPHVWGWQLDNEPEAKADYSPSAQAAFRKWLKDIYQTIEALNNAWGTAFWSLTYSRFDHINIHNVSTVGWWGNNPHALLDFKRYSADMQAEFLDEQATILRTYISPNQFITTNYVAVPGGSDPRATEKLDFMAFTSYPNNGSANVGDQGFRQGNPRNLTLANDYFRPIRGVTGVLEIQPGQVNWGRINPLLKPGTVRMWLWHCFGAGSQLASSYRYRQILYGVEQYHSGIMKTDGTTPSRGGEDYRQFISEIRELRKIYDPGARMPEEIATRKTAILWSHENRWDHNRQPQSTQWDLWDHVLKYHLILKSFGAPVDYISEDEDFSKYAFLIVPAYQAVDSMLIRKWWDYASEGGALVVSCRTGTKDRNGHFWESGWAAPIYELIGAEIPEYDMLLPGRQGEIQMNDKTFMWDSWGDLLDPASGTETLAIYNDQFYAGKAAVVSRSLGKGSVTYIGVDTDEAELERDVLRLVFDRRSVDTQMYPEGVFVYWRDGFYVAVNYSSEVYSAAIPEKANILIGARDVPPAGVVVWQE